MPIFLEPDQRFAVVLDSDKDKSPQPTFWAKSQSMRGQESIADVLDSLGGETSKTARELFGEIVDKLAEVFCGWDHMGDHEYSRDGLYGVLTYHEARELLRKVMYNQHVTTEEKKSSESQP